MDIFVTSVGFITQIPTRRHSTVLPATMTSVLSASLLTLILIMGMTCFSKYHIAKATYVMVVEGDLLARLFTVQLANMTFATTALTMAVP